MGVVRSGGVNVVKLAKEKIQKFSVKGHEFDDCTAGGPAIQQTKLGESFQIIMLRLSFVAQTKFLFIESKGL